MSQSEAGPSRRRRPYVVQACNACKRRHSKCDGVQPVCGTCLSSGHECSWTPDNEDTRPATKQYLESLRVKIQVLESEIMRLRQANPQPSVPFTSIHAPGNPAIPPDPSSPIRHSESGSHAGKLSNATLRPTFYEPNFNTPEPNFSLKPSQSPSLNPRDGASHATQSRSTSVGHLSSVIMYQPIFNIDTSTFQAQPPENQVSLTCEWNRHLPDLGNVQMSRLEHDTILSRSFRYGTSWLSGLIPDLFLRDMVYYLKRETTHPPSQFQYYTPLLHCSLLAFSVALSDDPNLRARSTRDILATHAKQWLDEEFRRSGPTLVPSLALLSEYHYGVGERNTGYMYMGMSTRAARSRTDLPNPPFRDWCHWSTFVQEKLMALDSRRPSEIPLPNVPFSPPIPVDLGGRSPLASSTAALFEDQDFSKFVAQCFIQSCKLMTVATPMIDYTAHDNPTVVNIHLQLDSWFNSLPDGLLIRQRSALTLPHILNLHICYWWLILHLHLPLLERVQTVELAGEPVTNMSVKMCDRATEKLTQLFAAFDKQHGFKYFPRNLVKAIYACGCALLLERDLAPDGASKKRAAAQEGANTCISTLHTIGETWPCALSLAGELELRVGVSSGSL